MSSTFFPYTPDLSFQWDAFVTASPYGSVHQVSDWKTFQEQIPGRETVLGFGMRDEVSGEIIATTFCVKMSTGVAGKFWWYSARGPVVDVEKYPKQAVAFFEYVAKNLRDRGGIFWRFDPYFSEAQYLSSSDLKFRTATQNYQPTDTLEIDLRKSDDQILSEMKRKGRYNIQLARKKEVRVELLESGKWTGEDVKDFWKLNAETTQRDRFSSHDAEYYKKFLQYLEKYAVLFFAEIDGKRIATAISTFCGKKAIYYFGASSSDPEVRNLMAPYLLQWEMMQYGKQKGCESYDFLGIAPEGAEDHPYAGISQFKWKFGGERRTYGAGKEMVFSRLWYGVYRVGKWLRG